MICAPRSQPPRPSRRRARWRRSPRRRKRRRTTCPRKRRKKKNTWWRRCWTGAWWRVGWSTCSNGKASQSELGGFVLFITFFNLRCLSLVCSDFRLLGVSTLLWLSHPIGHHGISLCQKSGCWLQASFIQYVEYWISMLMYQMFTLERFSDISIRCWPVMEHAGPVSNTTVGSSLVW